jgi:hypothetical protein
VRRNNLPRTFEHTGEPNLSEKAMKSGGNTWSNGKIELLVSIRGPIRLVGSVYLAEISGFARLRPCSSMVVSGRSLARDGSTRASSSRVCGVDLPGTPPGCTAYFDVVEVCLRLS